ncbi:UNVERIFIED_CONTAM: hypothetical protein PYX00_003892 [Menopon gallinae]|uniref:CCAAT-binding factor domain-containing protein n=1 Tax=Menopon gallinae TaxID=328185 RepID=A0AAW2I313_9NEOP
MASIDVDKKVNEVLSSRKYSNNITELFAVLQNSNDKSQLKCLKGLERIFTSFLERKEFHIDPNLKLADKKEWEVEVKYTKWLKETYEQTLKMCYKLLDSNKEEAEKISLETLMKLSSTETEHPLQSIETKDTEVKSVFPEHTLEQILKIIISKNDRKENLIKNFETFVKYKDVYFYTWKTLRKTLPNTQESGDTLMLNILDLIEKIPIPNSNGKKNTEDSDCGTLCKTKDGKEFIINIPQVHKFVAKVWQNLIKRKITDVVYRKLMVILLEKFLPNMEKPIFFTDFFMASSGMKGANALLAMQGILTLVQKHNIEYPDIYGKLYTMFEPNIFHTKYKSRLFYLADIFLSSTHLPENLVASFAKRVSRLCLNAQIPDIVISIRFVENLLRRHPGLKKMIHHPEIGHVAEDPFLPDERDPMKTKAIESCLWEISLLKDHVQPSVSSIANFIDKSLPEIEFNLKEVLDLTYDEIFKSESRKKVKACLSVSRPQKIAKLSDDRVYKMWALT